MLSEWDKLKYKSSKADTCQYQTTRRHTFCGLHYDAVSIMPVVASLMKVKRGRDLGGICSGLPDVFILIFLRVQLRKTTKISVKIRDMLVEDQTGLILNVGPEQCSIVS
jgi:hypothetical protein